MRFGWLTLNHSPSPAEDHTAIAQQMEQACLAETVGFDSVWLTEHNFTGESVYSDPIPFAGALAARTSRVRIGFAVIQMPLRHPVRLATQLSLLDNLSNGRLDVGIGRGTIYNEYEFIGYGLRSSDSRERMEEALDVLVKAWTEAPLHHKGRYFDVTLPGLRPQAVQTPHPPIWHSAVSPDSFTRCGQRGVPVMTLRLSVDVLRQRLALYETGLAASGLTPEAQADLRRKAAVWRNVHVAESQAQAEDELAAALIEGRHHMNEARKAFNPPDFVVDEKLLSPWTDARVSDDEALAFYLKNSTLVGTPDRVAAQIAELREAGISHLLCQMSFGYLDHASITRSMRLFGERVMPRFK
ncbi:MAG: LLM class flavin-dependent oxidoreductase [Hyphomicrobiaceae bacterium]|nr:LLM class flavin-dependent oxidoreductase [Hyphomicrobiaceae bacterium]